MLWAAAAVLGIVATATVAWAASRLAAPGIGLSSEPPSVVVGLAPASRPPTTRIHVPAPAKPHPAPRAKSSGHAASAPNVASPPSVAVPAPVTPTPPVPTTPAASPTTPQAAPTAPSSAAPPVRTTPNHRDDSSGGSGDSRAKRDD